MAVLTNAKTWTKIYRSFSAGANSNKETLRNLKDDLVTAGFSHVESCDGTTTSTSVDLWDSASDLVWATAGNAHSWIVLSNDTMASGLKICIDLSKAVDYEFSAYLAYSSFSGGTTTDRPTASNEIEIVSGNWGNPGNALSYSKQYNFFYSSDSKIVRVFLGYNGTTQYGFWNFDLLNGSPAWIEKPVVVNIKQTSWLTKSVVSGATSFGWINNNGKKIAVSYGGVMSGTTNVLDFASLNSGDYNGDWPCTEVTAVSVSSFSPGILGQFIDLWFGIDDLADFDTFPSGGTKSQVVFGDLIQGSDGSVVSW